MKGTIELRDLRVHCIVGILPQEREVEQDVFIDIEMDLDFGPAADSEDIARTVDYSRVAQVVQDHAIDARYLLIETMSERIASLLLARWQMLDRVLVRVKKPAAVPAAANTAVSVERFRER